MEGYHDERGSYIMGNMGLLNPMWLQCKLNGFKNDILHIYHNSPPASITDDIPTIIEPGF